MRDPPGEADRGALRLDFNRRLMLQSRGSAITSDAGLLAYRELDEDVNDADWLCRDPAMRWVVGDRAITRSAASASQLRASKRGG
jgi:hypothetical protein